MDALWWPRTAAEVAEHCPTAGEWQAEVESGWPPCDGSSCSLDDIEGIRIGRSGTEYAPWLPANRHDYDYRVIRRLVALRWIDEATRSAMQAAADEKHLGGLLERVSVLIGWNGFKARARAHVRYHVLRLVGWRSTLPRASEEYRVAVIPPRDGGE
jgi:hypothetical protein